MPGSRDGWIIFEPVFDSIVVRFDRTLTGASWWI
jgi:hypothetical protein